jgi:hypothetical protein
VTCVGALHPNLSGEKSEYATIQTIGTIKFYDHDAICTSQVEDFLPVDIQYYANFQDKSDPECDRGFFYVRYSTCYICRPSDFTVSEDAGIEPIDCCCFRIDSQTLSNHTARSHFEC